MKDGDYFLDATAREEELRKINEELDAKLNQSETIVSRDIKVDWNNMDCHSQDVHGRSTKSKVVLKAEQRFDSSSRNSSIIDEEIAADHGVAELRNDVKVRLQLSRVNALSSQLKEASKNNQDKETKITMLVAQMKKIKCENQRLQKELNKTTGKESSKRVTEERRKIDLENLTIENQTLRKEVLGLKTIVKESEAKSRANEIQLTRALESVDKFKRLLSDGKSTRNESDSKLKAKVECLQKQLKDMEKQRNNILLGFKEQMKLIEVLKRQKVHAEASKLLDITEQEFLKIIEWDCKASKPSTTTSQNKQPLPCKS